MWGLRRPGRCRWPRSTVHPHVCGVYIKDVLDHGPDVRFIPTYVGFTNAIIYNESERTGSSPRMWGLLGAAPAWVSTQRFIPTYVGFTHLRSDWMSMCTVHPHVCGVYDDGPGRPAPSVGSSPRMWGLRCLRLRRGLWDRFIPTYVGFTAGPKSKDSRTTVHPHVCGVYYPSSSRWPSQGGSSPRMWGLPHPLLLVPEHDRFIPTYVGFTWGIAGRFPRTTVHPHVCGVYRRECVESGQRPRFIPTYVGFTQCGRDRVPGHAVHPHVCGVYPLPEDRRGVHNGSSPRMWGLRQAMVIYLRHCAVHPHVCGVYFFAFRGAVRPVRFIPTYVGFTNGYNL